MSISWNGTVFANVDGVYEFTAGIRNQRLEIVPLLRSDGEVAKVMGMGGCDHIAKLTYLGVTNPSSVIYHLRSLPENPPNTLHVGYPSVSFPNCILVSVSEITSKRETKGLTLSGGTLSSSAAWTMECTLTFRQLG